MTDLVPPGNMPLPSVAEAGANESAYWQGDFWDSLWPRLIHSYATSAERDAELAGLSPTSLAVAYLRDTKLFTYWNGTAWVSLSGRSSAKAGKRVHWGQLTATPNGTGYVNVTHGAGFTPTSIVATTEWVNTAVNPINITSTTFEVRILNTAGSSPAAPTKIMYFCGE
jgi:hypothetical protein